MKSFNLKKKSQIENMGSGKDAAYQECERLMTIDPKEYNPVSVIGAIGGMGNVKKLVGRVLADSNGLFYVLGIDPQKDFAIVTMTIGVQGWERFGASHRDHRIMEIPMIYLKQYNVLDV